jgi:hypothetical protein
MDDTRERASSAVVAYADPDVGSSATGWPVGPHNRKDTIRGQSIVGAVARSPLRPDRVATVAVRRSSDREAKLTFRRTDLVSPMAGCGSKRTTLAIQAMGGSVARPTRPL